MAVVLAISVAVVILTSETRTDKPDLVPFANITQITAGWQHSCALTRDGAVHCWGWNGKGQLGDDSTNDSTTPVQVHNLTDITQVTAGGDHTCALTRDGTAHCWGDNTTSADSEVAARARERGQLGDGTTDASLTPVKVRDLTDITQITAGEDHTCALTQDGTAHCWGANHDGQLGTGSTDDSLVAVRVQGLTDVIQLSAGSNHTCALTQDGTAQCWGNNFHGQLGSGTTSGSTPVTTPVPVRDLAGIAQVTAGDRQTCALLHDGTARCWGWNDWGQLGNGSSNTSSTPVQVRDLTDISQITAGLDATCAVTQGGAAHCWGRNALGDEAEVKSPTPVRVRALTGVTQIVSSVNHVCSLAENGTALCWGFNGGGRLGNGTNANSSIPVQVVVPES